MPTIRFWAGARALAGVAEYEATEGPLPAVLESLRETFGDQMASLVRRSVLVVDGQRIDPAHDSYLEDGSVLEILPPYAGG